MADTTPIIPSQDRHSPEAQRWDSFHFHGISATVISNTRSISDPIRQQMAHFLCETPAAHTDIQIALFDSPLCCNLPDSIPPGAKQLYAPSATDVMDIQRLGFTHLALYQDTATGGHFLDMGPLGLIRYNLQEASARGFVNLMPEVHPLTISGSIFSFVFSELLKSKGLFPVHSAGVSKAGRAVLIPGFSGAGKTTTCIALLRHGYDFLSDDRIIVSTANGVTPRVFSVPEPIDVTDQTIAFFPELNSASCFTDHYNLSKKSFHMADIYSSAILDETLPGAILFPHITSQAASRLEKISKDEAFRLFLPHSLLVFDKQTARRNFDTLYELLVASQTYRLHLGADLEQLGPLVDSSL